MKVMPVRKIGKDCYQWGNQKVYCGKDAKRKATLQGIAIENTGWQEAEEVKVLESPFPTLLQGNREGTAMWLSMFCGFAFAHLFFRNR
jgi:hypothetical protein